MRITLTKEGLRLRDAALDARRYVGFRMQMSGQEVGALRHDIMELVDRLGLEVEAEAAE